MLGVLPNEGRLYVRHTVSNLALAAQSGRHEAERYIVDLMRQEMAHKIAVGRLQESSDDYSTTYSLDVYVLSPDALARLVQQEAYKLAGVINA